MNNHTTPTALPSAELHKGQRLSALNRRQLRALIALLLGPASRQTLDEKAGVSNSPKLVANFRRRGLELPCKRQRTVNCYGDVLYPGVYFLTSLDRVKALGWLLQAMKEIK